MICLDTLQIIYGSIITTTTGPSRQVQGYALTVKLDAFMQSKDEHLWAKKTVKTNSCGSMFPRATPGGAQVCSKLLPEATGRNELNVVPGDKMTQT